jgi:hypothetical protein
MDRVTQALGLGLGRTEEEDSLQPSEGRDLDNVETRARPTTTGTGDDESWDMLVAERMGTTMAVTQPQEQEQVVLVQQAQRTIPGTMAQPGTNQEEFSGIGTALKRQGHLNYEPITVAVELSLQRNIQGNPTKQAAFQEFATNYTQMRVYLAMVGEQKTVTMIHTIGAFYSIRAATNLYRGKILRFIGDRRATKEPTPVCLPQNKAWQWCVAQVNTDKEDFMTFYESEENTNKW